MSWYDNNPGCLTAIAGSILGIVILFVFALIFSLPIMWLWNWLMPGLFNLPEITWIQAWGISLLSGFLFKGSSVSTNTKS